MMRLAITIEGGLIASDLVEQVAASPQDWRASVRQTSASMAGSAMKSRRRSRTH
jgi:hypothetical protein